MVEFPKNGNPDKVTIADVINANNVIDQIRRAEFEANSEIKPTVSLSFHLANLTQYFEPLIKMVAEKEQPLHQYVDEEGNVDQEKEEVQELIEKRNKFLEEEISGFDPPKIPKSVINEQKHLPFVFVQYLFPFVDKSQ